MKAQPRTGTLVADVLERRDPLQGRRGPEQTYTAGQMFLETPGQLHAVSYNASATKPAKLLAVATGGKGAPITTPA